MIKLAFVLRSSKGRCCGNYLILGPFTDVEIDCLHSLLWRSKTNCHLNALINSCDDAATLCKNLVNFDPVTPDQSQFDDLPSFSTLEFPQG